MFGKQFQSLLFQYCNPNNCRSFTFLKAIEKSKGNIFAIFTFGVRKGDIYRYRVIFGRAITLERAIKKR